MPPYLFIEDLKRIFPETSWPWLVPALRHDPSIWQELQGDFGMLALEKLSKIPAEFSPANLSLLALEIPVELDQLKSEPAQSIESMYMQDGSERIQSSASPYLAQVGYLALNYREHHRTNGSWEMIIDDLPSIPPTVLACLFGMIPRNFELLEAITASPHPLTAAEIILMNPLDGDKLIEPLNGAIKNLAPSDRLKMYQRILSARPGIIHDLISLAEPENWNGSHCRYPILGDDIERFDHSLYLAEIQQINGNFSQALANIEIARSSTKDIEANLAAYAARIALQAGDMQACLNAWQSVLKLDSSSSNAISEYGLALIKAGRIDEAKEILNDTDENQPGRLYQNPLYLFAQAELAYHLQDIGKAREYSLKAISLSWPDTQTRVLHLCSFAHLLRDLSLPGRATQALEIALEQQPNDPEILNLATTLYVNAGDLYRAREYAQLAVAIAPDTPDLHHRLADCFEVTGDWQAAYQARESAIARQPEPGLSELRALASNALRAGKTEEALSACHKVLERVKDDGETLTLLGEVLARLGYFEQAQEHIQNATQLLPDQALPWLSLARIYQEHGQHKKSLDSLLAGTLSAPEDPTIQLALGEAYLQADAPTQALDAFQRAAELWDASDPQMQSKSLEIKIGLYLSQTLDTLGHSQEAREVLEKAHRSSPAHPEIAYRLAHQLLVNDEPYPALNLLQIALGSSPQDHQPYLDYARCIVAVQDEIDAELIRQAIPYLHAVLKIVPEHAEAKALLAEVLAANREYQQAMQAYRHTMETGLAQEPEWSVRLNLGLADVALQLGENEAAIAALQEALHADALNPEIHRSLSQAYNAAGLVEDALQEAQIALEIAPDDLDILVWFAQQALELYQRAGLDSANVQNQALEALDQATQLAPRRMDLIVKLAQVQIQIGDEGAAHASLSRLISDGSITADSTTPAHIQVISLRQAAQDFLSLGDAHSSVICLEGAIQAYQANIGSAAKTNLRADHNLINTLVELATAQHLEGDLDAALSALDKAHTYAPNETYLSLYKASLLLDSCNETPVGEPAFQAALEAIVQTLEIDPFDPVIYYFAAKTYRLAGDLPAALTHAEKAIELSGGSGKELFPGLDGQGRNGQYAGQVSHLPVFADLFPFSEISARVLAAEIAMAILDFDQARVFLMSVFPDEATTPQDQFEYFCLLSELALEAGDTPNATRGLTQLMDIAPEHSRTLVLQARLAARKTGHTLEYDYASGTWASSAVDIFRTAFEALERSVSHYLTSQPCATVAIRSPRSHVSTWLAIGKGALELRQWQISLDFAQQLVSQAPEEPISHLFLAQVLTIRAEFQRFYRSIQVTRRAPGEEALNQASASDWQAAITSVERLLNKYMEYAPSGNRRTSKDNTHYERWLSRGEAVFHPSADTADKLAKLPKSPEDTIAQIACLGQMGNLPAAGHAGRAHPHHPYVLAQLALPLAQAKPRQALVAAKAAIESLAANEITENIGPGANPAYLRVDDAPLLQVLLAIISYQHWDSIQDQTTAFYTLLSALDTWSDEPRWHYLAANLFRAQMDPNDPQELANVITHLEHAVQLDPNYAPPHLDLGEIYLKAGYRVQAQTTLERACQLNPDELKSWILLAAAHRANGNLEQARICVERALEIAPDAVEPNLLSGEIALEEGQPQLAGEIAEKVLATSPDNSAALVLRVQALEALNRSEEALETISQVIPKTEYPLPLLLEQVHLFYNTQGLQAALSSIQSLASEYPDNPQVLTLLAELLEEAGEDDAAIQILQRAIRCFSETTEAPARQQAQTYYLLGKLMSQSGHLDQAIFHLTEAIQLDPTRIEAYIELGQVHQDRRQHTQALEVYQKAISAAPNNPQVYYQAALALKESKDYIEAERMLRHASELAPDDVKIHRLLGALVALNLVHNLRTQPELSRLNSEYIPSQHGEVKTG